MTYSGYQDIGRLCTKEQLLPHDTDKALLVKPELKLVASYGHNENSLPADMVAAAQQVVTVRWPHVCSDQ